MASCRLLLRNRLRISSWQYASLRYGSSTFHPVLSAEDPGVERLRACVKATLPWKLDEPGPDNITKRKEIADLLETSLGSQVKSIATACMRTCPFAAALLPEDYVTRLNRVWVIYNMKDEDFMERHLWLQGDSRKPKTVVHDDWLHIMEVQDFIDQLVSGATDHAEVLVSPYALRLLTSKDWNNVHKDTLPASAEFATQRYIVRALKTVETLRRQIDFDKPFVQGTVPLLEDTERWCTIFRLLQNIDNGLSSRPLVGFHDYRADLTDGSTLPPFLENKVEILSLIAYRDGIMSDSELDMHVKKMLLMHTLPNLCSSNVTLSPEVLSIFFSYLLLSRVDGWVMSKDFDFGSSDEVRRGATQLLKHYFQLRVQAAEQQCAKNTKAAQDKLARTESELQAQQAEEFAATAKRIDLMEEVWGDEKEIATDEVHLKQKGERVTALHSLKSNVEMVSEERHIPTNILRAQQQQLQEIVDNMHVMMMSKPRQDTSFIVYSYSIGRQVVSISHSLGLDESDVFSGIQVLSDKPAEECLLACNVHWFLRHLAHEPLLVQVLLAQNVHCAGEFKKLSSALQKTAMAAVCRNVGVVALEQLNSDEASVAQLRRSVHKLQQAHDLVSKKTVQYSMDADSMPTDVAELKKLCRLHLQRLEALCKTALGATSDDLSPISHWLKKLFKLDPNEVDIDLSKNLAAVDLWLLSDIPTGTSVALESTTGSEARLLAGSISADHATQELGDLLQDLQLMETDKLRDLNQLPPPPLPQEQPEWTYPEWRKIRKRRRQEDALRHQLRRRGKWKRGGRIMRCGWFLGMKKPPVDFSDCYGKFEEKKVTPPKIRQTNTDDEE